MHACKKNQYPTGIYVLPKWKRKGPNGTHVIEYCLKELLLGMHAFNFKCFLDDFNSVFTQIRCLSVLLIVCNH